MQTDLQQSVLNVANSPKSAVSVSAATMGTGISTILEIMPPILGVIATFLGIVLTALLIRNHMKRWQLMDIELKLKNKQLQAIDERKKSRENDS